MEKSVVYHFLNKYRLLIALIFFVNISHVSADSVKEESNKSSDLNLGEEYSDFHKEKYAHSGKARGSSVDKKDRSFLVSALLFVPNRVLDLLDILRFDVGVGPSVGGVIRITPYAQAGVRFMMPLSLRLGLRGRRSPVFIEHTNELGAGPLFLTSEDRRPSVLECGVGADLLVGGVYLGISFDSIADFLTGFVGYDLSDDDI